jgi:hypothetical protein
MSHKVSEHSDIINFSTNCRSKTPTEWTVAVSSWLEGTAGQPTRQLAVLEEAEVAMDVLPGREAAPACPCAGLLSAACAAHAGLGPASLVLYDVSTLYFETDEGDGLRESGSSKKQWPKPQITVGLPTDRHGFPLVVSAFEGNRAETKTMLPVIEAFIAAHRLPDATAAADAGMVSEAN